MCVSGWRGSWSTLVIRSASRMNGAVVLFLDKVEKVNTIVENGIVLNGSLIKVLPTC